MVRELIFHMWGNAAAPLAVIRLRLSPPTGVTIYPATASAFPALGPSVLMASRTSRMGSQRLNEATN
jgi:hypothetical protein